MMNMETAFITKDLHLLHLQNIPGISKPTKARLISPQAFTNTRANTSHKKKQEKLKNHNIATTHRSCFPKCNHKSSHTLNHP